uniref:Uncharacterized protein n=1 Tax=Arundo donax TaxID=35708 RepID=A0A0A9GTC5_ARUDO
MNGMSHGLTHTA